MECYHLLSGPGLLHVLWADAVSPSQQEKRLLPPVSRPGSNLRLSGDVHRCGHTRAPKVTQGLPQRVSLSSPTQGPQIWSRQLITTCQTQSYTYIKPSIFTIWIDFKRVTNHHCIEPLTADLLNRTKFGTLKPTTIYWVAVTILNFWLIVI